MGLERYEKFILKNAKFNHVTKFHKVTELFLNGTVRIVRREQPCVLVDSNTEMYV